jgi:hypothetical protein
VAQKRSARSGSQHLKGGCHVGTRRTLSRVGSFRLHVREKGRARPAIDFQCQKTPRPIDMTNGWRLQVYPCSEALLRLRRMAEAGCSEDYIASISGHKDMREIRTYVQAANKARMASEGMARTLATSPAGTESEANAHRKCQLKGREIANSRKSLCRSGLGLGAGRSGWTRTPNPRFWRTGARVICSLIRCFPV